MCCVHEWRLHIIVSFFCSSQQRVDCNPSSPSTNMRRYEQISALVNIRALQPRANPPVHCFHCEQNELVPQSACDFPAVRPSTAAEQFALGGGSARASREHLTRGCDTTGGEMGPGDSCIVRMVFQRKQGFETFTRGQRCTNTPTRGRGKGRLPQL